MIIYPKHSVFLLKPCVHSSWGSYWRNLRMNLGKAYSLHGLNRTNKTPGIKAVQSLSADSDRKQLVDYSNLSSFAIAFKQELTDELGSSKEANKLISYLQEIQEVRNKCNHYQPLDEDEIDRAFGTMKLVAKLLQMPDLVTEIDTIKNRGNEPTIQIETPVTTEASSTVSFSEDSPLPAWYTNVYPHYDIRNGSLDESVLQQTLAKWLWASDKRCIAIRPCFLKRPISQLDCAI